MPIVVMLGTYYYKVNIVRYYPFLYKGRGHIICIRLSLLCCKSIRGVLF